MVDLVKQDMTFLWSQSGDIVAPDNVKIDSGWGVETVPRQWWNWMQNRVDTNVAYALQKGIPEWDTTTEYIADKSYVQHNGVIYKATATTTNENPALTPASWVKAFAESSASLEALKALVPAADSLPYFTGGSTATLATLTAFARTILDDPDAVTVRATISAQAANSNLTALSGVSANVNVLPYFTGTTTMAGTTLTSFGRSLIDDADATTARATLGLGTMAVQNSNAVSITGGTISGITDLAITDGGTGASTAAGARTNLAVYSTTEVDNALATKQALDATLTALAGLTTAADRLPYFTGVDTATVTTLTAFARTLLDDVDAAAARATLGAQQADPTLTALAGVASTADTIPYFNGVDTATVTTLTAFARSMLALTDAAAARTALDVYSKAETQAVAVDNAIALSIALG